MPKNQNSDFSLRSCLSEENSNEEKWIQHALNLLTKDNLSNAEDIVWAAYHASKQLQTEDPPVICALLPIFYEKAALLQR